MGQRLVVTIRNEGKELCKMYYHWSAYSASALQEVRNIIKKIPENINNERDLILHLIHFCEKNGGGIEGGYGSSEWNYIQSVYPDEEFEGENINRNYGLIAISEDGMADIQNWSEGDVTIDIDEGIVHNEVFYCYNDIDEYKEDYEKDSMTLDDIPNIDTNIEEFDVDDIDNVISVLEDVESKGYVCRNGNEIYALIA